MMIDTLLFLLSVQPLEVKEFVYPNGLKLLVYEDHFSPVVTVQVHYLVGAYDEPKGLTGMSHLLEHMLYKGTKKYGPKEYDEIIRRAGGESNGYTSIHETCFHANLSKDRYTLQLEMEADRMQNCLFRQEDFVPEKDVVMEERRLHDNDPYGNFNMLVDQISYTVHPYRNPVIGYMEDLRRITRDDVVQWYKDHYNPANALIVVAGDVEPDDVYAQVKKYYGKIKGMKFKEQAFVEPDQNGERRFDLKREVMVPAICLQYHTVPIDHEDSYALDIVEMVLSQGRSSRLQRDLVRNMNIAARLYAYAYHSKYGGLFVVFGIPQVGVDLEKLESEIYAEVEALKAKGISDAELQKAKNQALAQTVYRLDSVTGIGFSISSWEIHSGSWQNINLYLQELQAVTNEDVIRVVNKYLTKENRTVGYLLPSGEAK